MAANWLDIPALIFPHAASPGAALGIVMLAVTVAYVIFGLAGFGTALAAAPILAYFLPLASIVPLLALLDFGAALLNIARDHRAADRREIARLLPCMLVGSALGALVLLRGAPQVLMLALGVFALGYAVYTLAGGARQRWYAPQAALAFGTVGGIFSALFGSGGFIYAIYLAGRLQDKNHIRVTQSTLIGFSTLTRLVIFLLAGMYTRADILALALVLLLPMAAGTAIGRRMTLRLSREQFIRLVSIVVACSGASLIIRYFAH